MNPFRSLKRHSSERGQATIMAAVLMTALMSTMGLAVEGGRAFVEYRRLQSAADMAAIVGAQNLPCNAAPPDASCISTAATLGCTYAASNGYGGCATDAAGQQNWASVPPQSCSPYDFEDWGNGSINPSCKSATAPPFYDYIEVHLTKSLGTVPIFNIPVTISAHAVAKHGVGLPSDFAILTLNPDPSYPLTIHGDPHVLATGSVFSNSGISSVGNATSQTCQGGWFSAGTVSGVSSVVSGTPQFAPGTCNGSIDGTPDTSSNLPPVSDPYGNGSPPPTQPMNSSFPNCQQCSKGGDYYDLTRSTWVAGSSTSATTIPGDDVELFPGVYSGLSLSNGQKAYFNPGVYTFTGGISLNHGDMCVYGSPSCENSNSSVDCSTTSFSPSSSLGDQWNYNCSPYGFWDSARWSSPANPDSSESAPTFTDGTPLNGVTFYIPSSSGTGIVVHGNGGKTGKVYLAAPNPCPGTGSYTPGTSVSFPAGSSSGSFSYTETYTSANDSLPDAIATSPVSDPVYPSQDFSLLGECNSAALVWPNEMVKPQHLHFLIYDLSPAASTINGASGQQFTGIVYAPGAALKIDGAGKGAGGPPFINGQLIANSADFGGNSYVDVEYRPCGPGSTACGSGAGTQLVE